MDRLYSGFTIVIPFRDGYDTGLGRNFNTQRERDSYIAKRNIRRI